MRTAPLPLSLSIACACALAACSTSHAVHDTPSGLRVHTFNRDYANAHVIVGPSGAFMVDAGLEANAPALADDLRAEGIDPSALRAVVLTHGHADHAGGAGYFARAFKTPIVAGEGDAPLLASGHNDRLCPTSDRARDRLHEDQTATYTPTQADVQVPPQGALSLQDLTGIPATVRAVPGHTPGSLVVIVEDMVFVGDLFRGAIVGSSAEVHFYMCDLDANRADIQALLSAEAPRLQTFYTGHFGPVERDAVQARFGAPAPQ